ncbi:MAG: NTP transferase domain-containing protein, partial [Armatimonadota bacterium]
MAPTLVVMAAGMGSRFGGTKQLAGVGPNGETILDYSVHDAISAGFGKVVFVIREAFADAFKQGIGARYSHLIDVAYTYQELDNLPSGCAPATQRTKPWGTAHAVWCARP